MFANGAFSSRKALGLAPSKVPVILTGLFAGGVVTTFGYRLLFLFILYHDIITYISCLYSVLNMMVRHFKVFFTFSVYIVFLIVFLTVFLFFFFKSFPYFQ